MKEKIKTFLCICFLLAALPYIITMLFQGKNGDRKADQTLIENILKKEDSEDSKTESAEEDVDVEEYLTGIVAKEMPMSYEKEALKAQAVAARTNLLDAMEKKEEIPESLGQEELLNMWGQEGFSRNFQRLEEAVRETKGVTMRNQGEYIYAAYHAVSAGSTRNAEEAFGYKEMPWLSAVDSTVDIPSADFLKVIFLEPDEMKKKLEKAFPEAELSSENLLSSIVIAARDSADYVTQVKLGEKEITGEEFREALGLNSACCYLADVEGKLRIVTKGLGHGLGLSQYGANEMAKEGKSYKEILNYYYKNIEITD